MTIINEIGSNPQICTQMSPYVGRCAERPTWNGAQVELGIFSGHSETPDGQEHELHIAGDLANVREALETALDMLKELEVYHKEEIQDKAEHSVECPVCGTWYDKRLPGEWGHPDGRGMLCVGDGSALLLKQPVRLRDGTLFKGAEIDFQQLRYGQGFCLVGDGPNGKVYEVRRNPAMHFAGIRTQMRVAVLREP